MKNKIIFKFLFPVIIFSLLFFLISCSKNHITININVDNTITYDGKINFSINDLKDANNFLKIPKKQGFKFEKWQYKKDEVFKDFSYDLKYREVFELYPFFKKAFSTIIVLENEEKELLFFENQELYLSDFNEIVKPDYILDGLYLDKELKRNISFPLTLTDNVTLYPKFSKSKKLVFYLNDQKFEKNYRLNYQIDENSLSFLKKDEMTYYELYDKTDNTKITLPFIVEKNLDIDVLYKNKTAVNIITNYEELNKVFYKVPQTILEINELIQDVYKEGFNISFFKDKNYQTPFEFPYTITTESVNIYINYSKKFKLEVLYENKLKIEKDYSFSVFLEDLNIDSNQKSGYHLKGFSTVENGELVDFPYLINKDTVLHPVYKKLIFINFADIDQYNIPIENILAIEDDLFDINEYNIKPEKQGYTFEGFYFDREFRNKIESPFKLGNKDITLYLKFNIIN